MVKIIAEQNAEIKIPHYHGDIVRYLFISAALIMLVGLPPLTKYLTVPIPFSIISILILGLTAGLANPLQIWVAGLNSLLSIIGFMVFETYAVNAYWTFGAGSKFFIVNLILSLIFIFAVYYSIKTLRGLLLNKDSSQQS